MSGARAEAGFSLVEMMIAASIIGIVAVLGVPSFMGLMPRIRFNSDVMLLSNEIALARVRAISKSTEFRIVFDPADESYETFKSQGGGWQSLGETKLSGSDLASAAGFNTTETLIASANGQMNVPLNSQAVIELRTADGANRKQIVVQPTGRVLIKKWNGAAWVQE